MIKISDQEEPKKPQDVIDTSKTVMQINQPTAPAAQPKKNNTVLILVVLGIIIVIGVMIYFNYKKGQNGSIQPNA